MCSPPAVRGPLPRSRAGQGLGAAGLGAHHDAITGSESDQVYLDLLTGWRDAWELGRTARHRALEVLSAAVCADLPSVVVWNPLAHNRTDIVTVRMDSPVGARSGCSTPTASRFPR